MTAERRSTRGTGWAAWSSETSVKFLIFYSFCCWWQPFYFRVQSVYYPSIAEKSDASLYSKNVQKSMAKAFGYSISTRNRFDSMILEKMNAKYNKSCDPELSCRFFVDGGKLIDDFGAKVVDGKELFTWAKEWCEKGMEGTLKAHVRRHMAEKVLKME